jgi:hypothetical protein
MQHTSYPWNELWKRWWTFLTIRKADGLYNKNGLADCGGGKEYIRDDRQGIGLKRGIEAT